MVKVLATKSPEMAAELSGSARTYRQWILGGSEARSAPGRRAPHRRWPRSDRSPATESGFFFGSTDYDEYYWEDLENTKTMLTDILAEPEDDAEFIYRASW